MALIMACIRVVPSHGLGHGFPPRLAGTQSSDVDKQLYLELPGDTWPLTNGTAKACALQWSIALNMASDTACTQSSCVLEVLVYFIGPWP